MLNIVNKNTKWGDADLFLETGKIARQAESSVLVKMNDTTVLVTVTVGKSTQEKKISYGTALTVNFLYKAYAMHKIPGGFIKREGKPSDREVIASRVIDRAIRPLFFSDFSDDVQVVCTLLAYDQSIIPEIPCLIGVSAALKMSSIPFKGPVVAAHVGYTEKNDYELNHISDKSALDLIVASTKDSIVMVESAAKQLTEDKVLDGIMFGHKESQSIIDFINEFSDAAGGKEKMVITSTQNDATLVAKVREQCSDAIGEAYSKHTVQHERHDVLGEIKATTLDNFEKDQKECVEQEIRNLEKEIVRHNVINNNVRVDGRGPSDIRDIYIENDILPTTHGSALFTRGNTQALAVVTLGDYSDEQIIDGMESNQRENFMLHYNFPPYSVGEVSSLRPPGRREIGHGKLAYKALQPVLAKKDEFPYTIRVVSEITESNGSSSMATVCGSSLALMTAGVPIKMHVAGIAMGLIKAEDKYTILSDILGEEDNLGDMDFKVAGTVNGVTALQMDIKIDGISQEILQNALEQARIGRLHILDKMNDNIGEPCDKLKSNAPQIVSLQVDKDDITKIIGTGGKVIKNICEVSTAKVDIDQSGRVLISAENTESIKKAQSMLNSVIAVPKTGVVYEGQITGIAEFGVFVRFLDTTEGLVHISEIQDSRVESIEDILQVGENVKVVVLAVEGEKRIKLSMKYVNQSSGVLSDDYSRALKSQGSRSSSSPRRGGGSGGGSGGGRKPFGDNNSRHSSPRNNDFSPRNNNNSSSHKKRPKFF